MEKPLNLRIEEVKNQIANTIYENSLKNQENEA